MLSASSNPFTVVLVGFDDAQSLDLVGPLEVFSMANKLGGAVVYEIVLASRSGGEIVCNSGLRLGGAVSLAQVPDDIDTLVISGGSEQAIGELFATDMLDWLRHRVGRTRRIASVCSGAMLLAAAGLLDERRATTHWGFCDALRALRPSVLLEPDAIFVADPPFYTSAGVTAGVDLCLSFVEADCGFEVALAVARNLVLFMRRPGGQTQFSPALSLRQSSAPRLSRLIAEISAEPGSVSDVTEMADKAAMSIRNFTRTFKRETGCSPATFLELARLDKAKGLLESSDWPLARVAELSAFGSLASLHRSFQKQFGVTPGDYRARFGRNPRRDGAAR
jgi:transcriptional regulator GlxA family with amidase domain